MFYLWLRNKHVSCQRVDGKLRIHTRADESYFAGSVTITVQPEGLQIVGLEAEMSRPIHSECRNALPILDGVVGTRIGEGLTKRIDGMVGGADGCTHMANLLLECCHGAAMSFRQLRMAEAFAAGLSADEFYSVFIQTRPKELLNSCVAFAADSPLLQRLAGVAGAQPSRPFDLVARYSGPSLPAATFSRNKFIGVGRIGGDTFVARGMLEDNAHSMGIDLEVRGSDLEIVRVDGQMTRVPNLECSRAVATVQSVVGLGLRPGLTAKVDELVGRKGCPHLANLLLEACHGVIQGTFGATIQDARRAQPDLGWDGICAQWLENRPMFQNTCLAYRDGSRLMQLVAAPVG